MICRLGPAARAARRGATSGFGGRLGDLRLEGRDLRFLVRAKATPFTVGQFEDRAVLLFQFVLLAFGGVDLVVEHQRVHHGHL
jgi:hypothetical protein